MPEWSPIVRSTNWQALFVSILIPLLVAAGLVSAALMDDWDDTPQWLNGLAALLPLEYLRALVLSIMGDTFRNYRGRAYAIGYFLLSLAILAALLLALAGYELGLSGLIDVLDEPRTWKIVLPLAAVVIADGLITLYFFTGDPGAQAARLEAAADDVADLLGLLFYPTPIVVILGYAALLAMKSHGVALAAAVPDVSPASVRTLGLFYVAAYFVAKAGVFAWVQTVYFNRSGERLLGGSWLIWLRGRSEEQRASDRREEQAKATRRRAALGLNDFRHP